MVLTRYKQRLIFPKSDPNARRYSLLRETYSSRPSPRSQGGLETSGTESSSSASSLDLSNSNLLLTNPSLGFIRYLSISIESLGLSTSDIDLYFNYGANLSIDNLVLSEQEIAIAKTLLLPAEDVVLSSNEASILRSKLLSEDTLINSGGDLSLSRNYLLNQLTLHLTSLDISIDASTMLRLIEDNLLLSDVDILKSRLQDLGIDTVALTSEGSFQRILYLNPSLLWLETNTLPPYQPDLTQYLSLDLEVLQLSEVTPALSKLLQLYSDNLQLQTVNQNYFRYSNLSDTNLGLTEVNILGSRSASLQQDYINLGEENQSLVRLGYPSVGYINLIQTDITTSAVSGGGTLFLLEQISSGASSNVLGAFSLARRLTSTYTGNLVRLRRSSDNAESDFGFDSSGNLDESAVETWAAGTDAYVRTLYNQAGSATNLEQSTSGSQVIFVSAGNLLKYANRPAAGVDGGAGAGRYLGQWGTSPRLGSKDFALWIVHERNAGDEQPLLTNVFAEGQGVMWRTDGYLTFQVSGNNDPSLLFTSSRLTPGTDTTSERKCILINHDYGLSSAAYVNNTTLFGSGVVLSTSDYDWNAVGSYFSFRAQYKSISEFIIFNSQIIGSSDLSTMMTDGTTYYS